MGREHSGAWVLPIGVVRAARPSKSPDYIAEDIGGNLSVLECKGTQSSRASLVAALGRGMPQKANLQAIGATPLQHSLVAGLFIPQFDNADSAVIIVADPEWDEFKERLSRFSKEEIGRAVSQVAYAKELAMLELPHTANTLVRAEGSDETVSRAIERDLAWERAPSRIVTANEVGIRARLHVVRTGEARGGLGRVGDSLSRHPSKGRH